MNGFIAWLRALPHEEPAIFSTSTVAVLVPVLAQVFSWNAHQAAAALAIGAALAAAFTAIKARPVAVPLITGAATAIAGALAAWHLHVPGVDVAAFTSLLAILLGGVASIRLTPVAHLREQARQMHPAGSST